MVLKLSKALAVIGGAVVAALVAYVGAVGGWGLSPDVAAYLVGTLVGLVGGTGVAGIMGWLPEEDWE
jgi:hypothetical protein